MRLLVLAAAIWTVPLAAKDLPLIVAATQEYATCIATQASKTPVRSSTTAAESARAAVDGCAEIRQRLSDALDPRERSEYFARIDRDIQSVALELAGMAGAAK